MPDKKLGWQCAGVDIVTEIDDVYRRGVYHVNQPVMAFVQGTDDPAAGFAENHVVMQLGKIGDFMHFHALLPMQSLVRIVSFLRYRNGCVFIINTGRIPETPRT